MSRLRKKYGCGRPRGGTPGVPTDTRWGSPGNQHKAPRKLVKRERKATA